MKTKLESLELYSEETDTHKQYYLKAVYFAKGRKATYRVTIPRIALPVSYVIDIATSHYGNSPFLYDTKIDIGFGKLNLISDKELDGIYKVEEVEKKYTEMTLEEIERILDLNVKLVSEKKDPQ